MNFSKADKLYLLIVVRENGNISPLASKYSYSDIVKEIQHMIDIGWIINNESLLLSEHGVSAIDELMKEQKMLKRDWIQPYLQFKIEPIDENFIYLPKEF